jgi:hypothetical protein
MSIGATEIEVERAKSQLKAGLDGTTAVAEDIGRQLVTSGKRLTPQQIESALDAVAVSDIKRVASRYVWGKDVCSPVLLVVHMLTSAFRSLLLPWEVSRTITASAQTWRPCFTRCEQRSLRSDSGVLFRVL